MPLILKTDLETYYRKSPELEVAKPNIQSNKQEQVVDAVDFQQSFTHQIPYEVSRDFLNEVSHQIPYEPSTNFENGTNNNSSDFEAVLSVLDSQQLQDNSTLNIDNEPQIVDYILNNNSNGFTPFQTQTQFKSDTSAFGPNDGEVNYFGNDNASGFTRNMATTLYNPNTSQLGPNNSNANYIEDRNAIGFTRFMSTTLLDPNSSDLGPNNGTANYITDINAIGFTRFVTPLVTLYDVNSSQLGPNDGSVNYFPDSNATGFLRNFNGPPTLYNVGSSNLGPNNGTANYFSDVNAPGFTRNMTSTLYNVNSSALGPNNGSTNYFADTNAPGFIRDMVETLLKPDTSELGPNDGSTNYFTDIHGTGFTRNVNDTELKPESTVLGPNDGTANYFSDDKVSGFTRDMISTNFDYLKSELAIKNDKQEINFIADQIAEGFNAQVAIGDTKLDHTKSDFSKPSEVNYIADVNSDGFMKQFNLTVLKPDTTQLAWGGGGAQAPNVDGFTKFVVDSLLTEQDSNYNIDETPQRYGEPATQDSPLAKFAITRRSPSPLDEQYNKYNLRRDSFNPDFIKMPYVLRGIQKDGETEPERWGGFAEVDGLSDFSPFGFLDYKVAAIERFTKFRLSGRGLVDIARQTAMQRMNPAVETDEGVLSTLFGRPTWIYNPLSTIRGGVRHGLSLLGRPQDASGRYEDVVKPKNDLTSQKGTTDGAFTGTQTENRLVTLYDELIETPVLSNPFDVRIFGEGGTFGFLGKLANDIIEDAAETAFPNIFTRDRIQTLSVNNGGPDSLMGIGPTIIRRFVSSRAGIPGQQYYNYDSQYASSINQGVGSKTYSKDNTKATRDDIFEPLQDKSFWETVRSAKRQEIRDAGFEISPEDETYTATNQLASADSIDANSKTYSEDDAKKTARITDGNAPTVDSDKVGDNGLDPIYRDVLQSDKFRASDPNSKHQSAIEEESLLRKYTTLSYGQLSETKDELKNSAAESGKWNDFRSRLNQDIYKTYSHNPVDYNNENIHKKGWSPDFGKPGRDKSDYKLSQLEWDENADVVKLEIGDIIFKALNLSFNESLSVGWNENKLIGRADPMFMFSGISRSGQINFTIIAETGKELAREINKLNRLYGVCSPEYNDLSGNGLTTAPIIGIKLGKIWNLTVAPESVSYAFDDDYGWDIDDGVPRKITVGLSFKVVMGVGKLPNSEAAGYGYGFPSRSNTYE